VTVGVEGVATCPITGPGTYDHRRRVGNPLEGSVFGSSPDARPCARAPGLTCLLSSFRHSLAELKASPSKLILVVFQNRPTCCRRPLSSPEAKKTVLWSRNCPRPGDAASGACRPGRLPCRAPWQRWLLYVVRCSTNSTDVPRFADDLVFNPEGGRVSDQGQ